MKARNLRDVKIANKQVLYECIRKHKQVSISELEHLTGLSRPTVSGLIRDMENEGVILCSGVGISYGGRAPMVYSINAEACFAIGIDFEFPTVRIAIANLEYQCVAQKRVQFSLDAMKDEIINGIISETRALIDESGIEHERFLGIGIGLPGMIDRTRNLSVSIERIRDWRNVHIGRILSDQFDMPVYLENDANLMAWAEYRLNYEATKRNRLFCILRYGIGMGIIVNGELVEGGNGNAGRIGHTSINADGPVCVCGNHGCLAMYASEHAIFDRYNEKCNAQIASAQDISELLRQDDPDIHEILRKVGYYLGTAFVGMTHLFDVSYITICTQFDPQCLREEVQRVVDNRRDPYRNREIELHVVEDHEGKYSLGGCMFVIDQFIRYNTPLNQEFNDKKRFKTI